MNNTKYLTVSKFARLIGVNATSVRLAIKKGRLVPVEIKGKMVIDVKQGQRQWAATRNSVASESGKKSGGNRKKRKAEKQKTERKTPAYLAPPKVDQDGDLTMSEAERREKVYKSQLSELKYLEQAGKLISVEKIQRRAFELARKTRDAIMLIPTRYAHELASETDPHKLEIMLTKMLQKALEKLSKGR